MPKKNKSQKKEAGVARPVKNQFDVIAENRKAHYNYFIGEKFEAGICLAGHEVKSIRERRVNIKDSFVRVMKDEAFLINCHISPYSKLQGHQDIDRIRTRKLLLKRNEINRLMGQSSRKGVAIVPLRLYFKKGFVKVEIALAEGKKKYDKRETIKKKMHDRESSAAVKRAMRK